MSDLAACAEHARSWLHADGATALELPPVGATVVSIIDLLDAGRNTIIERVMDAGRTDDDRAAALLALSLGRGGDIEGMLSLAAVIDLDGDDGAVRALVRLMADQQRSDGSVGFFAPDLRVLGAGGRADAGARRAATELFVRAVGRSMTKAGDNHT